MRRLVLSIALALAAPLAFAGTPTDAQVDRLFDVMHTRQTLETTLGQMETMQDQMIAKMTADKPMSAEEKARLDRVMAISRTRVRETLAWDKIAPLFRKIYAESFDSADVDALIAFYGSPAGQHFIERMPVAMQKTMTAMQDLVVPMLQQMQQDLQKEMAAQADPVPVDVQ
ncbi:DUF2059 domain-containing protein [Lysobacter sp. KIS68-7]|uniref:DUF2059 domain-containing protein n=1 Tax=Lysobacter sp. KIS68-7 TaxID=2904252 RepID=UPI001E339592|nr:DUF2059 domain-containing protein [Lysobacter sp. KIS68-7]UHQ20553.1 DUF2059 domain-containing protein [Lysobacter sp. KIS68-7]